MHTQSSTLKMNHQPNLQAWSSGNQRQKNTSTQRRIDITAALKETVRESRTIPESNPTTPTKDNQSTNSELEESANFPSRLDIACSSFLPGGNVLLTEIEIPSHPPK